MLWVRMDQWQNHIEHWRIIKKQNHNWNIHFLIRKWHLIRSNFTFNWQAICWFIIHPRGRGRVYERCVCLPLTHIVNNQTTSLSFYWFYFFQNNSHFTRSSTVCSIAIAFAGLSADQGTGLRNERTFEWLTVGQDKQVRAKESELVSGSIQLNLLFPPLGNIYFRMWSFLGIKVSPLIQLKWRFPTLKCTSNRMGPEEWIE